MLKIIESLLASPIRFPTSTSIISGQVIQIDSINLECIPSNGHSAFGLFEYAKDNIAYIWTDRMVFRTDEYQDGEYGTGDLLYTNSEGFLTNICPAEHAIAVGRVITVFDCNPPYKKDILECVWF